MTTRGEDRAYPSVISDGLTKREYFAAHAILESPNVLGPEDAAIDAVAYADALIAELNKK